MQLTETCLRVYNILVCLFGVISIIGIRLTVSVLHVRVRDGHGCVRVTNSLAITRGDSLCALNAYGGARLNDYSHDATIVIEVRTSCNTIAIFGIATRVFCLVNVAIQHTTLGN